MRAMTIEQNPRRRQAHVLTSRARSELRIDGVKKEVLMAAIVTSEVTQIADSRILPIATRVVREFELVAEKVACNHTDSRRWPLPEERNSIEALLVDRFRTLPAALQQSASARAVTSVSAAQATRIARFSDLSGVDLTLARPVELLVRALPFPRELKLPADFFSLSDVRNPFIPSTPALNQLEFRLHSIRCVDETDGFLGSEAGSDEISIGGTTVDETGDVEKLTVFNLGSFSSDGAVRTFSPPRSIAKFDLTEAPLFPAVYYVTLVLAEVDMGGLPDFVNALYNKVRQEVITALTTAIGTAIGATAGPAGAVLGAVVGFVVGEVFRVMKTLWEDDVFRPATLEIVIPSRNHRFENDATDSNEGITTFSGHGGRYQVVWDWRLFA